MLSECNANNDSGTVRLFTQSNSSKVAKIITAGPDGNLWFTEQFGNKIGRITPAGAITEFTIFTPNSTLLGITAGPDGNLWFTESQANKIGRITPAGVITEFAVASGSQPTGITSGPDGNLWFTEAKGNKIGRLSTAGTVTGEFALPTATSSPQGIVTGPDGNLWFTESQGNNIGRITPSGAVSEFPVPTPGSGPQGITVGADGRLWFTELAAARLGSVSIAGVVTEGTTLASGSGPFGIVTGPDGKLWVAERDADQVARVAPLSPAQQDVARLYQDLLGRAAEPEGLSFWAGLLSSGQLGSGQVAVRIVSSPEGHSRAADTLYREVLHRAPDPAGLVNAINFLAVHSAEQLRALLFASAEYYQGRAGGTDAGFLASLFQDVLGRAASLSEETADGARLGGGPGARLQLATDMLGSVEANLKTVQGVYQVFLRHPADLAAVSAFLALHPALSDQTAATLVNGVFDSAAYQAGA